MTVGDGLVAIGNALNSAFGWAGAVLIATVVSTAILISMDKIKIEDIKNLFERKRW